MSGNEAAKQGEPRTDDSATCARPLPPVPPPPPREPGSGSSSRLTAATPGTGGTPSGVKWRMAQPYKLVKRIKTDTLLFEGKNTNTARRVTIQLINGADEMAVLKRVDLARQLTHPNTVRLLDAGVVSHPVRVGYLVREYVDGVTLGELLERRQLSTTETLAIVDQMLDSLKEAHTLGLHHGRLAPEHVLVSRPDDPGCLRIKLIGYWTLSNRTSAESGEYVAPDGAASVGGDLYAVTKLLLRCLTGSTNVAAALQALPTQAEGLAKLIRRALNPRQTDRYEDVEQFRRALASGCRARPEVTGTSLQRRVHEIATKPRLVPRRRGLMSTRESSIWVLAGDPVITAPAVKEAVAKLGGRYPVRLISQTEREAITEELRAGRLGLPWVVVFGGTNVLVQDPLLALLSTSVELSRLLISSHEDLGLLQDAIFQWGLDGHLSLPQTSEEIVHAVESLLAVTKRLSNHYDAIRLALRRAQDSVDKLSHAIAADEVSVSNADSLGQLKALTGGARG